MKKILLIEDDSNYIWHIKNFLQRKGYHVLVAFTVSQGKELIEKEQILIIGSDLKLSDGSGMELLEYLREKTYKIPFPGKTFEITGTAINPMFPNNIIA